MSDENKKKLVSFSVQLPEQLNSKVEAEAKENKRSKNLQINWIVEKYYDTQTVEIETAAVNQK